MLAKTLSIAATIIITAIATILTMMSIITINILGGIQDNVVVSGVLIGLSIVVWFIAIISMAVCVLVINYEDDEEDDDDDDEYTMSTYDEYHNHPRIIDRRWSM